MRNYLLGTLLVCSISLAACSNNNDEKATAASTEQFTAETTEKESETTFEDGILENDDFILSYKEAKVINSPQESKPGLYVTYKLENKSEESINPKEIFEDYILMEQENDSSLVELDDSYSSTDAFAPEEDTETYNKQADKENKASNDLKPEKEESYVKAYYLDSKEVNVQMSALIKPETDEYSDPYEIKLDELEEIPEPKSKEGIDREVQSTGEDTTVDEEAGLEGIQTNNTEYRDTEQEAQDDYWKAKEFGLTEDEIAEFTTNKWYGDPAENDGSYYEDLDDYLNEKEAMESEEHDFVEDEITEEEAQKNIEQVEQFRKDFKAENGREPTSGEIQAQW